MTVHSKRDVWDKELASAQLTDFSNLNNQLPKQQITQLRTLSPQLKSHEKGGDAHKNKTFQVLFLEIYKQEKERLCTHTKVRDM